MAMLICHIGIQAQTNGSLSGTVSDPQGAVVAGATVKATNAATGSERVVTTNTQGVFQMSELNPGTYTVSIENKGFKKSVAPGIIVSVSKDAQLTITLEVGGLDQQVTVTSTQDVINTTSPNVTSTVNTRQVTDLPLGGRNPVELAGLQAGIAVVGTDVRGSSISGLRQTAVNLTQDGINAMDNFVKTSSLFALTTPSLNSTSEFSVTTGTVGSDAGRGGAQVNLVTKGGSNDYHGGAFGQIINNWTDANTWFNGYNGTPKPVLRQHYLGFDIGGPVHFLAFNEGGPKHWSGKDKAFFFFSYERFVQNDSRAQNRTVLTQSARDGIFQYARTCPTSPVDPNCNNGVQTVNLLAQPNVPFNTKNPLLTAHLALIPLPNNNSGCGGDGFNTSCYTFNAPQLTSNDKYVFRYDHQILKDSRVGSHKIEIVYSKVITKTYPDVTTNGLDAPFPGGVNGFQSSRRLLFTPALVSTFGSNITNTLRYGRQWAPVSFDRDSFPNAPFISLPGVLTNYDNTFLPQPRNTIVNQVTDNLTWVKGNHLFKFGTDFQNVLGISRNDAGIVQLNQLGQNNGNLSNLTNTGTSPNLPGASSATLTTANTVYTAVVGLLGSASRTFNVQTPTSGFVPGYTRLRQVKEKDIAFFGQDQWRVASNFTLSYGIRYDYMGVPIEPNGLAIQPGSIASLYGVSGNGNLFKPTAAPGSQTTGVATLNFVNGNTGVPLYKDDWNNFAPFVGFAWSPNFKNGVMKALFGGEGKSSIRAGYSISYLHDGVTTFTNLLGTGTTNPGLIQTASFSALSCVNPADPTCVHSNLIRGQLTGAGVPLDTPAYKIPITDRDNFLLNPNNGLWTADPNLRSPYVHQWNVGIEREIMKDTAIEVRYVANYAPNGWRAYNINEVNIFENGFLQEFKNAQVNLALQGNTYAPGCAGCLALPIFTALYNQTGLPTGQTTAGQFSNSTFITNLNNNNVGGFANTLAFSTTYRANRENPALGLPGNLFVANPNAAFVNILKNDSKSNYNALEIEFRRRFSSGLQFQLDYTFSKALGDAVDNQGNSQADLASHKTLRDTKLDYRRSGQDQKGRFISNGVYELPFGKGRQFFSDANGFVDRTIGGWSVGAIVTWATGVPFSVVSGRSTFNAATGNNGAQLSGITFAEFKKNIGIFRTPGGLLFVNPNLLNITLGTTGTTLGKITSSTLKAGLLTAPAPGTFGNFPINELRGPAYFNFDLSVTKRIPITEKVRVEIKSTFINVLNHPNFNYGTFNFDSTSFGRITSAKGTSRQMNFIGQIRF